MTYFPYLRGMRHELAAVRALIPMLTSNNNTVTIIEPVKFKLGDLESTIKALEEAQSSIRAAVIVNPMVGDKPAMSDLISLVNQYPNSIVPAFIAGNTHNRGIVTDFIANTVSENVAIIHDNDSNLAVTDRNAIFTSSKNILWDICINRLPVTYLATLASDKIYIEDAFNKRPRNADYPNDDFFSDLHTRHSTEGYVNFGDYTIMTKEYREGGGPANAVALHMLYKNPPAFRMKHFVSNPILEPDPVGIK